MVVYEIDATSDKTIGDKIIETHEQYIREGVGFFDTTFNYDYSINDCVLVRTTNHFPFGGVVQTPENAGAVIYTEPSGMTYSINQLLNNYPKDQKEEIKKKLLIKQKVRRKTLHFTINGLVGSHMYGDFSGRPFIIIEPLKYHIDSSGLNTMRVEDTYFDEDIVLSDEATIVIRKDIYERIKDDVRYKSDLEKFRIILFTGNNEELAISNAINYLGYDAFIINNHGYVNGLTDMPAGKMYSFISKYAQENGIKVDQHYYSKERYDTIDLMYKEALETTQKIIQIMCKELNKQDYILKKLNNIIRKDMDLSDEDIEYMNSFINEYGLDKLIKLIERVNLEFDQQIEEEKQSKKL